MIIFIWHLNAFNAFGRTFFFDITNSTKWKDFVKGFVPDSGHWDYGVGDGVQGSWVLFVVFPLFFIFCYLYLFLLHIFPISVYIWWLILYHFQNSPTVKAPRRVWKCHSPNALDSGPSSALVIVGACPTCYQQLWAKHQQEKTWHQEMEGWALPLCAT